MRLPFLVFIGIMVSFATLAQKKKDRAENVEFYTIVETMPTYPGGDQALVNWVAKTVQYPAEAKEAGISGKTFVSFIVNKKGKVTDVKVARSAHPLLDKAAVECIKKLKGYRPGMQKGKPVPVQFTIPINFQLK